MALTPEQTLAVERIWRAYKDDPVGRGRHGQKYVIGDNTIQIVLTSELFDFSEASAGVMGYGARPVGIRRTVNDAHRTMDSIMESPETLAQFILTSDRSGPAHADAVRERRTAQTSVPAASDPDQGFWSKYGRDELARIKAANKDHQQLVTDFRSMTLVEFEEKYMLAA